MKELANIRAKLNAGKTLNARESKVVREYEESQNPNPEPEASETTPGIIEVTLTDLIHWGFTRDKAKGILNTLTPCRVHKRIRFYDCGQVVNAFMGSVETDADRKQRADADLAEEKVKRMKNESVDRQEMRNIWTDKLTRLRDAIKASEIPTLKDKRNLCAVLRAELDRMPTEIESATFYPRTEEREN